MTQTKIDKLSTDPKFQISLYMDDEASRSNLAVANRMFGCGEVQKNRLLVRFAQFVDAGKLEQAIKLLDMRPDLSEQIQFLLNRAVFRLAGFGEQDKMAIILKLYPQFFCEYAVIKDISNVTPVIDIEDSKGITLFQHAIWAGDVHYMCNMMLDCLPKNDLGETLRLELLRQYNELMDNGVVYVVNGKEHREIRFSLQTLIGAFKNYLDNSGDLIEAERIVLFCEGIGLPQMLVPAIVRHHYCNLENSFGNKPDFHKEKLIRSLKFINYRADGEEQVWDNALDGLGSKFAICAAEHRSIAGQGEGGGWDVEGSECWRDVNALTNLCEVTEVDLSALLERLQTPIQILDEEQELTVTL